MRTCGGSGGGGGALTVSGLPKATPGGAEEGGIIKLDVVAVKGAGKAVPFDQIANAVISLKHWRTVSTATAFNCGGA